MDEKFPGKWMGRGGPMRWPARFPDLTPCDFFLWGFIKFKVYGTSPNGIPQLKERITAAFGKVTVQMRQKTMQQYRDGLETVFETGHHHVEVHICLLYTSPSPRD